MKGYNIAGEAIVINRELTELDRFVQDFLKILKKHCNHLIVSGFVSISSGRTRGTEDVDIIIPVMNKNIFNQLFDELTRNGFWCYQGDSASIVYDYIKELNNIRFARDNEIFPNMKVIPFNETKKVKMFEFNHPKK